MRSALFAALLISVGISSAAAAEPVAPGAVLDFSIPAQPLSTALIELANQAKVQVLTAGYEVDGIKADRIIGRMTLDGALEQMLKGSGFTYRFVDAKTITIVRAVSERTTQETTQNDLRLARKERQDSSMQKVAAGDGSSREGSGKSTESLAEDSAKGIPEILVKGSRSINTDIRRSEDSVQPYVVFDRSEIARSGASTPEEFLKTRLPMNTQERSNIQGVTLGPTSSINLRGLGTNQTLILVDGRRLPSVTSSGTPQQPDINGIPLAAIERIEVLPATASGIYGGGATGGVLNIVTRKDYVGLDLSTQYGSSFRGDAENYRVDASLGFSLESGRTQVIVAASLADSEPLLESERIEWAREAREQQLRNNPSAFFTFGTTNFPPFGYTTNIRSQNGTNLVLDNGAALSSPFTFVPVGYAGRISDNGAAFVPNAGRYNLEIPNDLNAAQRSMVAGRTVESTMFNVRRGFGDRVDGFLDASWFENEGESIFAQPTSTVTIAGSAANNPFTTAINVSFPLTTLPAYLTNSSTATIRATSGAIVRLARDWTAAADYTWARVRASSSRTSPVMNSSVTAALQNGALDVIRDLNAFPVDWSPYLFPASNSKSQDENTLNAASLRLSGPLYQLPAGNLQLSSLVEWREEETSDVAADRTNANGTFSTFIVPRRSQSVTSYYLESLVPLISDSNPFAFARELELQASVRHDAYRTQSPSPSTATLAQGSPYPALAYFSNEVSATKYTLGLRYVPLEDLTLRASFGTGFLPPAINQIVPNAPGFIQAGAVTLVDPKRERVSTPVAGYTSQGGGNPDLVPENSKSFSLGFILTPRSLQGLRLSLDYTRIEKTNEIQALSDQQILDLEDFLPGRVTRLPLQQSDAALGYTGGVITFIDRRSVNVAETRLEAYDLQADQSWDTDRFGRFHLYSVVTWLPHLERQAFPDTPFVESVGYRAGVALKWRGNVGLAWERGPWTLGWNAQYFDESNVCRSTQSVSSCDATVLSQGSIKIGNEIYHDASMSYRFDDVSSKLWSGLELSLGIQNVFDQEPAWVATTGTTQADYGTFFGDPRLRRFTLNLRKNFGLRHPGHAQKVHKKQ